MKFHWIWISLWALQSAALPQLSFGFRLEEHHTITSLAATEFQYCFPSLLNDELVERVQTANRNEDINFARKWSHYSHFFHPTKSLKDSRRWDSSIRLIEV